MHPSAAFGVEPLEPRTLLAVLTVTTAADDGPGSLREAIRDANAAPGEDEIQFRIPVPDEGVAVIRLASELDTFEGPGTLEGYTQPGSRWNGLSDGPATDARIRVQLAPAVGDVTVGLRVGRRVRVYGLSVTGFAAAGIVAEPQPDGPVGGENVIWGNFLGLDPAGRRAGNGVGVVIESRGNEVGGMWHGGRNVISGNGTGVVVRGDGPNKVIRCLIGTDPTATTDVGNDGPGVLLDGASGALVGWTADERNVIAFNRGPGVAVTGDSAGNTIRFNSIHSNGGPGIDLGNDGPTPNDGPGDADEGVNGLQNFPAVWVSRYYWRGEVLWGDLESRPDTRYVLDFYATGQSGWPLRFTTVHVVSLEVSTDAQGRARFSTPFNPGMTHPEVRVTATELPSGNTSEFSPAFVIGDPTFVTGMGVSGTRWPRTFFDELAEEGLGSRDTGYRLQPQPLAPGVLPWANIDRVTVQFRPFDDPGVGPGDLVVRSSAGTAYRLAPDGFSYDRFTGAATWTLEKPLGDFSASRRRAADQVVIDFGEGILVERLNVVPGDANRNGNVAPTDYGSVRSGVGRSTVDEGTAPFHYTVFKDVNANGNVSPTDVGLVRGNLGANLVTVPEPAAPTSAGTTAEWFATQPLL
ncbi:MAG TPA: right-handed parallel beta-helix repeat-containing protein [Tepidisphaeraceae bacterium]|nr:right-handed parallel beta-helix repeat-containing protein [Tepidisphaeraceae bacterium]